MGISREYIEDDYNKIKTAFQKEDNLKVAYNIANQIKEHEEVLKEVFAFLISSFKNKFRNDKKTPLVFHSIYLTRLFYLCGERDLDALLTAALHDLLEDTEISEDMLIKKRFMIDKKYLIGYLKILKEDKTLSREPDGKNLPPRYVEHIKRLIGSPREVINTEIIDRFSDLMDLEYIMELPKEERKIRLRSKLIKVKSFVENITRNRNDLNQNCLDLFNSKVKELKIKVNVPLIIP